MADFRLRRVCKEYNGVDHAMKQLYLRDSNSFAVLWAMEKEVSSLLI